ncbi:uncharacterized protein [Onthophagus taurus]|uniref:uncharacterized protein isoform X2 n=1 Tax=Onthophagus taurus TaxID=166361 RepID=UPI000C1FFD82|nr:uncharacterized protein LOC111414177 isoform X2 [Onthophagus taurus]
MPLKTSCLRFLLCFIVTVALAGNQKSQHNKNQKPCHQLPPGLQGRPESSLPPGQRKKGPPCPAPSFQDSSTQSPSFETAEKLYGSKDFQFKDVQEFIENKPYEIQGYTKDNFPVVLLKKYDIRK